MCWFFEEIFKMYRSNVVAQIVESALLEKINDTKSYIFILSFEFMIKLD